MSRSKHSTGDRQRTLKTQTVAAIVIAIIAVVLLAGTYFFLGRDSKDTAPQIVWYAAMLEEEWELYRPIVDEFTERTGIQVQVVLYGGNWEGLVEKLSSEVNSGKGGADIVTIDDFMVSQAQEYVENLTERVKDWGEWEELYYGKKNAGVLDQQIYYLPWRADCLTMYVNTDKLSEHGLEPPTTMEELLSTAETLYQKEGSPRIGIKARKYEGLTCEISIFIRAYGGDYLTFNTAQNIAAFEFLQNLSGYLHPNSKTWDEASIPQALLQEDIYINFNWPYQVSLIVEEGLGEKIRAYPNPFGPIGRGTTMGGGFLGLSKSASHKEEAWEFLKFLVSARGQGLQLDHVGWLPVRDDAWNHLEEVNPSRYTDLMAYRTTLKYGLTRPALQDYPELTKMWQDVFWEIVWEGKPVEASLNKYQAIWESK